MEILTRVNPMLPLTHKLDDVPGGLVALAVQPSLVRVQLDHRPHVPVAHSNLCRGKTHRGQILLLRQILNCEQFSFLAVGQNFLSADLAFD